MRVRLLLVLVLSLGIAGLGAVLWNSTRPAPLPAAAPASKKSEPPSDPPTSVAPASAPVPVAPTRVSDGDAKSGKHWWDGFVPGKKARREQEEEAKAESVTVAVEGNVVVVDADGREHLEESGTLRPLFCNREDPSSDAADADESALKRRNRHHNGLYGNEVEVEKGRFHVDVPTNRDLFVSKLNVGSRTAIVDSEPVRAAAGQPVTIRAHWFDGVRVRVIDHDTRAGLDDVTVAQSKSGKWYSSNDADPGDPADLRVVVEHGHSPVLVPPSEHEFGTEMHGTVWFRASGHAWRSLEIDFEDTTERTVELVACATLVVDVQGELAPRSAAGKDSEATPFRGSRRRRDGDREPVVRLRKPVEAVAFDEVMKQALEHYDEAKPSDFPDGRKPTLDEFKKMVEGMREEIESRVDPGELVAERPARLGDVRFEALAVQDLVATIEIGRSYDTPLVLATAPAKLAAGTTTKVTLVARKAETPAAVPLAGSIYVPPGWDLKALRLEIEPTNLKGRGGDDERKLPSEQWTPILGRARWYRWDAGVVFPANYSLQVDGAGITKTVDVAAPGNPNVEIVLPEPAILRVRVVDSTDRKPVKVDSMSWVPRGDGDRPVDGFQRVNLEFDTALGCFSGRVPVGAGKLHTFGFDTWEIEEEDALAEVHPGEQELVVRVHKTCGVSIDLTCEGSKVAWSDRDSWTIQIKKLDGANNGTWWSFRDSHPVVGVHSPGRCLVTLPDIDGYEPVPPFEIEIPAGEIVNKTVELHRKL